jgi:Arc/MetJ-type ribon-helix-helix transcriptional regulator
MTTTQVAVRLANSQVERVDRLVGTIHGSRSDVIRRALDLYLYRLDCERDARRYDESPLSDQELGFADDPKALASMPEW